MALWRKYSTEPRTGYTNGTQIWARSHTLEGGWGKEVMVAPADIVDGTPDYYIEDVTVLDDAGNALMVASYPGGWLYSVEHIAGAGWMPGRLAKTADGLDARSLSVALSPTGETFISYITKDESGVSRFWQH